MYAIPTHELIEYIAAIASITGVWLTVRHHAACWIANATGALLYTVVFWWAALYANALLQLVFMMMSIYGWLQWNMSLRRQQDITNHTTEPTESHESSNKESNDSAAGTTATTSTTITRASLGTLCASFCSISFGVLLLAILLLYATDTGTEFTTVNLTAAHQLRALLAFLHSLSGQQILDIGLTALSLWATWLTAHQYIENWIVWVIADVFYCGLFVEKQLWATALLYGFFCIFAGYGYYRWSTLLRKS